ncbi:MAG: hypothetical protein AB1393_10330 [Candidatus Edwardsbacteria bacterium]
MNTKTLAVDYLERARKRQKAWQTLFAEEAYADVIREAQRLWRR